jgi:hypothetical protein
MVWSARTGLGGEHSPRLREVQIPRDADSQQLPTPNESHTYSAASTVWT